MDLNPIGFCNPDFGKTISIEVPASEGGWYFPRNGVLLLDKRFAGLSLRILIHLTLVKTQMEFPSG